MNVKIDLSQFENVIKSIQGIVKHSVDIGLVNANDKVMEYAIYNEYGTRSIPARPFYRTGLIDGFRRQTLDMYIKKELEEALYTGEDWNTFYKKIGEKGEFFLKDSLLRGGWDELSESTIKKKGRSTPLIDTSALFESIGSEVK